MTQGAAASWRLTILARTLGAMLLLTALCQMALSEPPASAAKGLHASVQQIALPGSARYEQVGLQTGEAGSVWVVGRQMVWDISTSGHVLRSVPIPAGSAITRADTATATPDGGVSFFVVSELLGGEGPMLDHEVVRDLV